MLYDTTQAIWGLEALALRTVSGRSVPGEATKQLTPAKVQVVQDGLICLTVPFLNAHGILFSNLVFFF